MKTPQILTGQQAIDQFGLNALIECRVAITAEINGLGHSVMQIGVIADPDNCFIDLSDEPAVLYIEIEQDDDWILHPIMADEQFVLLEDKNQPDINGLKAQVENLRSAAKPLVDHYFNWAEINEPDFTCDHNAKLHSLYSDLNGALRQAAKVGE